MKSRFGFVSNSSSSSFIIAVKTTNEEERVVDVLRNSGTPPFPVDAAVELTECAGYGREVLELVKENTMTFDDYWGDRKEAREWLDSQKDSRYYGELYKIAADPMVDLYVVQFSDEGTSELETELRSECDSFDNIKTDRIHTFSLD